MELITVKLDWTFKYHGTSYGPGIVAVPRGLADALSLRPVAVAQAEPVDPGMNAAGRALPPVRGLAAHLATLTSVGDVNALRVLDDRATAQALYDKRVSELSPTEPALVAEPVAAEPDPEP